MTEAWMVPNPALHLARCQRFWNSGKSSLSYNRNLEGRYGLLPPASNQMSTQTQRIHESLISTSTPEAKKPTNRAKRHGTKPHSSFRRMCRARKMQKTQHNKRRLGMHQNHSRASCFFQVFAIREDFTLRQSCQLMPWLEKHLVLWSICYGKTAI